MSERPTDALRYTAAKYGNECGCRGTDDECAAWDQVQEEADALDATLAAKDRRIEELERAIRKAIPECEGCVGSDAAKFFLRPAIGLDDHEEVPEEAHNGK